MTIKFPDSNTLEASVLRAIQAFGGSASTNQIDEYVGKDLSLTPAQLGLIRAGNRTEIQYRLAWVRTKAKSHGLIVKTANRTWQATDQTSSG